MFLKITRFFPPCPSSAPLTEEYKSSFASISLLNSFVLYYYSADKLCSAAFTFLLQTTLSSTPFRYISPHTPYLGLFITLRHLTCTLHCFCSFLEHFVPPTRAFASIYFCLDSLGKSLSGFKEAN